MFMPVTAVRDSHIAHTETGSPDAPAMVLLHGNTTSSYLWRHVTPHVEDRVRTPAPDLVGMGDSGKPEIASRFAAHARYLDAWSATTAAGRWRWTGPPATPSRSAAWR
jgi:haloalkane dehalogenase